MSVVVLAWIFKTFLVRNYFISHCEDKRLPSSVFNKINVSKYFQRQAMEKAQNRSSEVLCAWEKGAGLDLYHHLQLLLTFTLTFSGKRDASTRENMS